MTRVNVTYKPAQTAADLPPGSKFKAMDAFLLSDQLQDPVEAAAKDVAFAGKLIALEERFDTGGYADSIEGGKGEIINVAGRPRVTGVVTANGGTYPGAKDPESSKAAVIEFGNPNAPAARILGRAGDAFHTPLRPL